jgi:transposase
MDLHGIGPSSAARRRGRRHHQIPHPRALRLANGTAPIDASSGDQVRHRLSCAGNRQINRALHIMATVACATPPRGRAYYDRKKAAGKTSMEAMRCLIGGVSAPRLGWMPDRGSSVALGDGLAAAPS